MADLINRQDVLKIVSRECREFRGMFGRMEEAINALPTIEPERKKGKWILREGWDGDDTYECSECGAVWYFEYGSAEDNGVFFCPNCGSYNGGEEE